MDAQDLINRIIKDAKTEKSRMILEANKNAKANIEFAKNRSAEQIKEVKENSQKLENRENEITAGIADLRRRLNTLRAKTEIMDNLFDDAMDSVKYDFRVEKHKNYELNLTKEELGGILREQIEKQAAEMLFE